MIAPRLDILPVSQRVLWPELRLIPRRFVLYGGTAIALRLGHRQSVDFDFFASEPLDTEALRSTIPWLASGEIVQQEPSALTILTHGASGPVKLSFFGALSFGRVGEPVRTDDDVMCIASPIDLLAHKLKVMLQRAEGRDYEDVAALLGSGLQLADGLAAAAALFMGFPEMQAARALGYRDDVNEPERISSSVGRCLDDAVARLPEDWRPKHLVAGTISAPACDAA